MVRRPHPATARLSLAGRRVSKGEDQDAPTACNISDQERKAMQDQATYLRRDRHPAGRVQIPSRAASFMLAQTEHFPPSSSQARTEGDGKSADGGVGRGEDFGMRSRGA
jgi:hypothetical protein